MLPGKRRLIAGLAGVVAAVLFVEVDPMKWYHEQTAVYSVDKTELFDYITSPGDVQDWFPLFKGVFDVDKTPLNVGKVYKAEVEFLGMNYLMSLKVKRFVRSSTIVLEGDSLLRPIIKVQAGFAERGKSKLTMGVYYNRTSTLFQYTLAPILKFFTGQHMRHSMFVIHWLFPPQQEKSAQPM